MSVEDGEVQNFSVGALAPDKANSRVGPCTTCVCFKADCLQHITDLIQERQDRLRQQRERSMKGEVGRRSSRLVILRSPSIWFMESSTQDSSLRRVSAIFHNTYSISTAFFMSSSRGRQFIDFTLCWKILLWSPFLCWWDHTCIKRIEPNFSTGKAIPTSHLNMICEKIGERYTFQPATFWIGSQYHIWKSASISVPVVMKYLSNIRERTLFAFPHVISCLWGVRLSSIHINIVKLFANSFPFSFIILVQWIFLTCIRNSYCPSKPARMHCSREGRKHPTSHQLWCC